MPPAIADFMIHVTEALSEIDMTRLADSVCDNICVMTAYVSQDDPHLMIVNYDSNCASVRDIIGNVARIGVHAQVVGGSKRCNPAPQVDSPLDEVDQRIARLMALAAGIRQPGRTRWLERPRREFGGVAPLEMLKSTIAAR